MIGLALRDMAGAHQKPSSDRRRLRRLHVQDHGLKDCVTLRTTGQESQGGIPHMSCERLDEMWQILT